MSDDFDRFLAEELETDPDFRETWSTIELAASLGTEIHTMRIARGLTVEEVSRDVGLSEQRLVDIELGADMGVTLEIIGKIVVRLCARATVELRDVSS